MKQPRRTPGPSGPEIESPLGVPGEDRDRLTEAESDSAFRWAGAGVTDRDVLVVGCGRGHGAHVLLEAGARSVVGVDPDPRSIEIATHLYGERIRFTVAELTALPLAAGSFNAVVCFDAPDPTFDPHTALGELERVLTRDGLLLLSIPLSNSSLEPDESAHGDAGAILEGLDARYEHTLRFRRRIAVAAVVAADDVEDVAGVERASWLAGGQGEDRTVLVAASNAEIPPLSSLASMISFRDLQSQQETLAAWEERARRAEADGSAKHWELVAAREAQRRLRMRLHHIEHRPLRRLGRILRGKPARISAGPKIRDSERKQQRWE